MQQDTSSVVYLKYAVDSANPVSSGLKSTTKNRIFNQQSFIQPDSGNQTNLSTDGQRTDSFVAYKSIKKEFRFSDIDTVRSDGYVTPINIGPGFFSGHDLTPLHNNPQTYNKPNPDWFTVILFGIVFGFMWIRVFYFKILKQIFNAFFNSSVSNQIVRDENILIQRASVMLSILFYLVSALFLYQVSIAFQWQFSWLTNGFSRLIIFAFFIAFAYSAKLILLKLIGFVLDIDKPVASYIFNIFLMNNILGIILLPVVIFLAYVSTPFTISVYWLAISVIAATFIYRIIRGISIGMTIPKFSVFYLFLYLCAFEIAPLALIFKLMTG